ncbi:MAG TPA: hypothetical protein VH353_07185 [Caulobacteraceae bacterium]|nr:hypothetical protein [Caulobacteraceae bacterium]
MEPAHRTWRSAGAAPSRPAAALALAVAGKRSVPEEATQRLEAQLKALFEAVVERLHAIPDSEAEPPLSSRFDLTVPPRLMLVTGLADGADRLAVDAFLATPRRGQPIELVLGAVVPCESTCYIGQSPVADVEGFTRQVEACAFVIELDGSMADGSARDGAFQAQAEILLRHTDLLVAIDDPDDEGRLGGTRQTIGAALQLGMPVALMHTSKEGVAILRARADFDEPVFLPPTAAAQAIWRLVGELMGLEAQFPREAALGVGEFFAASPPRPDWRNWLWSNFERAFDGVGRGHATRDGPPFEVYRARASVLANYYAGQYRGAFLAGYALAVMAVALAAASLMALPPSGAAASVGQESILATLGVGKLVALTAIMMLARDANRRRLAHRAADWRYLTERLRAMAYLPCAGALRAAVSWSLPYTTRLAAEGMVDQLFQSIVRQVRPLEALHGELEGRRLRQAPAAALTVIRHEWLNGQRAYHQKNARTLGRMTAALEVLSRALNWTVVAVVAADLALLVFSWAADGSGAVAEVSRGVEHRLTPTFILIAAVLPAAIASLAGIRFQSECARLADRSQHMAAQLHEVAERAELLDLRPVRALDALRLAEDVATLTIDEVVEWSAIYGKAMVEM